MAKGKSSISIHGTTFTKRDVELIVAAIGSTKSGLNPNMELWTDLAGFASPADAAQAWDTVKRKYGTVIDALKNDEDEAKEVEEEEKEDEEEVAIKPIPKSAARGKPLKPALKAAPKTRATTADDGDSGPRRSKRGAATEPEDNASPTRKPAKAPVKKGRASKAAKRTVYAGADEPEPEPETEHPAVVIDKRAGAEAVMAMQEDEDDLDEEMDDGAEELQAPAKKRGRPAKKGKGKVKKAKPTVAAGADADNSLAAYEHAYASMKSGK